MATVRGAVALDAVAVCRKRCWKQDWVLDLDVQTFFEVRSASLLVKAVEDHTSEPWVVLYVRRWLAAPMQSADGTLRQRDCGTPQGSL